MWWAPRFRSNEIFVPEVLVAARAMNAGVKLLKPHPATGDVRSNVKACPGTVIRTLYGK